MRYIRTKDTIFEVIEETDAVYRVKAKGNPHNIYSKSKCQTEVVKFADTIESLVDRYVCVEPNGEHTVLPSNSIVCCIGTIIYGAIWTEWGLKYVAKMNIKGGLELL
jgi:hypothetical protein